MKKIVIMLFLSSGFVFGGEQVPLKRIPRESKTIEKKTFGRLTRECGPYFLEEIGGSQPGVRYYPARGKESIVPFAKLMIQVSSEHVTPTIESTPVSKPGYGDPEYTLRMSQALLDGALCLKTVKKQ